MKIMIGGGFDEKAPDDPWSQSIRLFAEKIGQQAIRQGHEIRSGNMTALDAAVIEAAAVLIEVPEDRDRHVISYTPRQATSFSDVGAVRKSGIADWNSMSGRKLKVPEPIAEADVVILVGGYGATYTAANWARHAGKPILPIASFGLAAEEIYEDELSVLQSETRSLVKPEDFQRLSRAITNPMSEEAASRYASEVVALAERIALSRDVFVIMSFAEEDRLEEYLDSVRLVCDRFGFKAIRVDQKLNTDAEPVVDSIHYDIASCGFVIADLTNERPNVYYEIGYARGLGKNVVLTAHADTTVHFDIQGFSRIEWTTGKNLRDRLEPTVRQTARAFGLDSPE